MSESKSQSVETRNDRGASPFTEPFGFARHLKKSSGALDFIPFVDLIVVGLFVSLMFTRFVVLPGVKVDLPATDMRIQHSGSGVAVLTIGANQMLFFNNGVYEAATIGRSFGDFVESNGKEDLALLIKVQSSMDVQTFLQLVELAQGAGFSQVQIVGQKKDGVDSDEFGIGRSF